MTGTNATRMIHRDPEGVTLEDRDTGAYEHRDTYRVLCDDGRVRVLWLRSGRGKIWDEGTATEEGEG